MPQKGQIISSNWSLEEWPFPKSQPYELITNKNFWAYFKGFFKPSKHYLLILFACFPPNYISSKGNHFHNLLFPTCVPLQTKRSSNTSGNNWASLNKDRTEVLRWLSPVLHLVYTWNDNKYNILTYSNEIVDVETLPLSCTIWKKATLVREHEYPK